jgi:WD40 repeat protein
LDIRSNDGGHVDPGGKLVAIPLEFSSQTTIRSLPGGERLANLVSSSEVFYAGFSPDGRFVVTAGKQGAVEIWDLAGRRTAGFWGHTKLVWSAAFSPDGTRLATASSDQTARLWDLATARPIGPPLRHADDVFDVRFAPDGASLVTASEDRTVTVWDAVTLVPIHTFLFVAPVRNAAISSDGTLIAGVTSTGTVEVFDTATGIEAGRFRHAAGGIATDFGPRGLLTTGGLDCHAVIWDTDLDLPSPPVLDRIIGCRLSRDTGTVSRDTEICE